MKVIDRFPIAEGRIIRANYETPSATPCLLQRMLSRIPFITQKYEACLGLTLFKLGRYKLELWFAPADYEVKEHTHPNSDGEFFVVYGKNRRIWKHKSFRGMRVKITGQHTNIACPDRTVEEYSISNRKYFRTLTVRANELHAFSKGTTTMVWLCLEKWKPNTNVTSVATDIKF